MIPYRIHEGEFEIPPTWLDQSMNIFKLPAAGGTGEASVVVSRDPSAADKPFAEYVEAQADAAKAQLPDFKWLNRHEFSVGGEPAASLEFTWRREGRNLYLRQVIVQRPHGVLIFTLTASPEDRERYRPAWDALFASVVLRPPE